ncbi:hypothetical protein Syun_027405 [Stephania yunnanensis]|uniref:Uncharacterized protein n=1 Tax=Stephania yunnanensis TaxID=152371 RepID=A0AAP0EFV7_9MAGN
MTREDDCISMASCTRIPSWFESMSRQFAENPERVTEVIDKDEPTLRNCRALDVALRFKTMPKTHVTAKNAIAMVDAVIAFLSELKKKRKTW